MLRLGTGLRNAGSVGKVLRGMSTAPEKVEVFIDDKRVLVEPGSTVLQVSFSLITWVSILEMVI